MGIPRRSADSDFTKTEGKKPKTRQNYFVFHKIPIIFV